MEHGSENKNNGDCKTKEGVQEPCAGADSAHRCAAVEQQHLRMVSKSGQQRS
jgi:hypothetical protein